MCPPPVLRDRLLPHELPAPRTRRTRAPFHVKHRWLRARAGKTPIWRYTRRISPLRSALPRALGHRTCRFSVERGTPPTPVKGEVPITRRAQTVHGEPVKGSRCFT